MQRPIVLAIATAATMLPVVTILQLGPAHSVVGAHPGVHPPSPPTYDYDTATAGTQPPTSSLVADSTARFMETFAVVITAFAPIEDVQAILPPGFVATALPSPPFPAGTAAITFRFRFHMRLERSAMPGPPSYGPATGVSFLHTALNTNVVPNRLEVLVLASEFSDATFVAAYNEVFGVDTSRAADIKTQIDEKDGLLRMMFHVVDEPVGLNIKAQAEGPLAGFNLRFHNDPLITPFRFLSGVVTNPARRVANQGDFMTIPGAAPALHVAGDLLRLPGGLVRIDGVSPNVGFNRWLEGFTTEE
jgi:hypothetical protein